MKKPQRGQTILHLWDSRRLEQTGQNWLGKSGEVSGDRGVSSFILEPSYRNSV